jgi:hypothetical protein
LIKVPGDAVDGTFEVSIWLRACKLAVNVSAGGEADRAGIGAQRCHQARHGRHEILLRDAADTIGIE